MGKRNRKRNNYLTLDQASQMLGKPASFFFNLINKEELGATLYEGHWQITVRDFDKIRDSLPPEPEKIVHKARGSGTVVYDFLTDSPSKKPQPVPKVKPIPLVRESSVTRAVPSKSNLSKPKAKTTKAKTKKPKGKLASRVGNVRGGHSLLRKIKLVDSLINQQMEKYKVAERRGRSYDTKLLNTLLEQREHFEREYCKVPDPLGLLPPLPRNNHKKLGQLKSRASIRSSGQPKSGKSTLTEEQQEKQNAYLRNFYEQVLWTGHPPIPKRTEKRYYWDEED